MEAANQAEKFIMADLSCHGISACSTPLRSYAGVYISLSNFNVIAVLLFINGVLLLNPTGRNIR